MSLPSLLLGIDLCPWKVKGCGRETDPTAPPVPWWVVYTRPRCEKKIDEWLGQEGFDHYLPLRRVVRTYQSKKVERTIPLFTGYAFGAFPSDVSHLIYGSGHVGRLLDIPNQGDFIAQLSAVHQILEAGLSVQTCAYFGVGTQVRIHAGALRGLTGVISRVAGKTRLIVSVDMLQESVSVEIDQACLSLGD